MPTDAITFIKAMGFEHVDLFGFSMGGMIAQEIALMEPQLVRAIEFHARILSAQQDLFGIRTEVDLGEVLRGLQVARATTALSREPSADDRRSKQLQTPAALLLTG